MCVGDAEKRYTVILETNTILENNLICEDCLSDLQEEDWVEVHSEPLLRRGRDNDGEEESQ